MEILVLTIKKISITFVTLFCLQLDQNMYAQLPFMNKYDRQIILKGFGAAGQERLLRAKVLVVGAGGLGCPALQYLAAAGVGTIGIVDTDTVNVSKSASKPLFIFSFAIKQRYLLGQR